GRYHPLATWIAAVVKQRSPPLTLQQLSEEHGELGQAPGPVVNMWCRHRPAGASPREPVGTRRRPRAVDATGVIALRAARDHGRARETVGGAGKAPTPREARKAAGGPPRSAPPWAAGRFLAQRSR